MTNQDISPAELRRKRSNAVTLGMAIVGLAAAGLTTLVDLPELPDDPEHAGFLSENFAAEITAAIESPRDEHIFIPAFLIQAGEILQTYTDENTALETRRIAGERTVTLASAQFENDGRPRIAQEAFMQEQGSALLVRTKCTPVRDSETTFDCNLQSVELGGTDHMATGQPACSAIREAFTATVNKEGALTAISTRGPNLPREEIYHPQPFDENGTALREGNYLNNAFGYAFRTLDEKQTQAAIALNQFGQCRNEM